MKCLANTWTELTVNSVCKTKVTWELQTLLLSVICFAQCMQTVRCSSIVVADSKRALCNSKHRERCYSRYLTGFRVKWCQVNTCKVLFSSSGEWNLFADIRTREEPGWNPNQHLAQLQQELSCSFAVTYNLIELQKLSWEQETLQNRNKHSAG